MTSSCWVDPLQSKKPVILWLGFNQNDVEDDDDDNADDDGHSSYLMYMYVSQARGHDMVRLVE